MPTARIEFTDALTVLQRGEMSDEAASEDETRRLARQRCDDVERLKDRMVPEKGRDLL